MVLDRLRLHAHGATADEIATELGESVLSVRPRVSELRALGEIEETGERRVNESGRRAIVWRTV
jgi:predicted ArsR family transcriptional regulator